MNTIHAFLRNTFDKNPTPISFADFIENVRNGSHSIVVDHIRQFANSIDDLTASKSQLAKMKQQMSGFVPSLCFTPGNRTGGELSGILCVDYDDLGSQTPWQFKASLIESGRGHLLTAFTSVSGKGVAAFYRYEIVDFVYVDNVDNNTLEYNESVSRAELFKNAPGANFDCIMAALIEARLMLPGHDKLVKDFSRLRFVSYDPDVFYNPSATPIKIKIQLEKRVPPGKRKPEFVYSAELS